MIRNKNKKKAPLFIDDTQILKYLNGELLPREQREIEEMMELNPFLNDALEGLSQMNPSQIKSAVYDINFHLKQQVKISKRKNIFKIDIQLLVWIIVLVVFALIFLAWWIIHISVK